MSNLNSSQVGEKHKFQSHVETTSNKGPSHETLMSRRYKDMFLGHTVEAL